MSSPLGGRPKRLGVVSRLQREVLSGETLVASDPFSLTPRYKYSFDCPVVLTPQGRDEGGKWGPEWNRKGFLNLAVPLGRPMWLIPGTGGSGGWGCPLSPYTEDYVYLPPPAI